MTERELLRFLAKVEVQANGCVCWMAAIRSKKDGYGSFRLHGARLAHCVAYEHYIGPVPEGMQLDHTCHKPEECKGGRACTHRRCVNPYHLEPVTTKQNTLRGGSLSAINARKTCCKRGHEFAVKSTAQNTIRRKCAKCDNITRRIRKLGWSEEEANAVPMLPRGVIRKSAKKKGQID